MMADRRVVLLAEGRFGRAVAERVAASAPDAIILDAWPPAATLDDLIGRAAFVGLALWRRHPSVSEAIDAACARQGVPWSTVTLEGRFLVTGPLVAPGLGPCYRCYRRRWWTHVATPEREQVLESAYEADAGAGCAGFLPSTVTVAAASLALDRAEASVAAGRVRRLDLLNCVLDETRVVAVHGCERCGGSHAPGERYVQRLRPAIQDRAS